MNNVQELSEDNMEIKVTGTVEKVIYRNQANGYTVLSILTDDDDDENTLLTAVGEMGEVDEGENLLLIGRLDKHSHFGEQLKVEYCETSLPQTTAGIRKYLASGVIEGIGKVLAGRITDKFKEHTLYIMEHEPERLLQIDGITTKKCDSIHKEVKKLFALRTLMNYLRGFNIRPMFATRTFHVFGAESMDKIHEDPYVLCNNDDIGLEFFKADKIAEEFKMAGNDIRRLMAGTIYTLREFTKDGHTCVPVSMLEARTVSFLKVTPDDFKYSYNELLNNYLFEYSQGGDTYIYLKDYYEAETYIAKRLKELKNHVSSEDIDCEKFIDEIEEENNIKYESLQRNAIVKAISSGLLVLTGGPGTGKTTTLNAIISIYQKQNRKVMIAAPTGRAAKRISDLTGYEAQTIHRMLEASSDLQGKMLFKRNEDNPLPCNVVVIDEMSMVDVMLFQALLKALKNGCRIIMVGDSDSCRQ